MATERFHLVDARTGKYVRDAHGKPRLMAQATFDKQVDEMREQGYRLGKQDQSGDHEDDGVEEATGDDNDAPTPKPRTITKTGSNRVQ